MKWIWQRPDWPNFIWEAEALLPFLSKARLEQGKLLARTKGLGFELGQEASANILIEEVLFLFAIGRQLKQQLRDFSKKIPQLLFYAFKSSSITDPEYLIIIPTSSVLSSTSCSSIR